MSEPVNADSIICLDDRELIELDVRPSLVDYIKGLWGRRHFIVADGFSVALKGNSDYRLGRLWLLIQPVLDGLMYGFLFGMLLQTSRGIENFIGYLFLGLTYFGFMNKLFLMGAGLMKANRNMVVSFAFPRASIVLSQTVRYLFDHLPSAIISVIVSLAMQWSKPLHWSILLIIPLYILIHIFGTGLMLISSRITAVIPDARIVLDLASRFWFFTSGILFSIDRYVTHPTLHKIMTANPAHYFLESIRGSVLYGDPPSMGVWAILCAWSFGTFAVGLIYFWQAEERYVALV